LTNFTTQRTNFPKALRQSAAAADAIRDGRWPLSDIFSRRVRSPVSRVASGVLTWWDTYNPTLGTQAEVLSCNFETLIYVLTEADGDLAAATTAIKELSHLYCPGVFDPNTISDDAETTEFRREVQSGLLPPRDEIATLSAFTQQLVADIPSWDDRDPDHSSDLQEFLY
jgi:hypothetical protein